uniref:Ala_racemase_N domain-containing protein n=1 Tax=Hydatigena taeniaeformis TaxID=6205 RepID=A0A0R3X6R9_HYDTA
LEVENTGQPYPQLVAVSKTKPPELVIEAYDAGQKVFGENYLACPEIRWHFIGKLQSNKVKLLASVPNLAMVETISSFKIANLLDNAWKRVCSRPLDVLIQVNTSGEEQKGGVVVSELVDLYKAVSSSCPYLNLCGLMTIGRYGYDEISGPNPDFSCLYDCRNRVCDALGLPKHSLHLSMGMSSDYETAVMMFDGEKFPVGPDGKPLKPCCACPDTRKARDECIVQRGEENCKDLIEAHLACLRSLGFRI